MSVRSCLPVQANICHSRISVFGKEREGQRQTERETETEKERERGRELSSLLYTDAEHSCWCSVRPEAGAASGVCPDGVWGFSLLPPLQDLRQSSCSAMAGAQDSTHQGEGEGGREGVKGEGGREKRGGGREGGGRSEGRSRVWW